MRYLRTVTVAVAALSASAQGAPLPPALEMLEGETDDMLGITWYKDASQTDPLGTHVRFFFGMKRGKLMPLRLKVQYQGDDWVFAQRLLFKVDGRLFPLAPPRTAWTHENSGGTVWESIDLPAAISPALTNALASAKAVKVRFDGRYAFDHELSDEEVAALRTVYWVRRAVQNPADKQARAFLKSCFDRENAEREEAARLQAEIDAATEAARADQDKPGWKDPATKSEAIYEEPGPEKRAAFETCIEAAGADETDASLDAQARCYDLLH